jgi:hypothetical protein
MRNHGSDPGSPAWNGAFGGSYDLIYYRNGRYEDFLDLWGVPHAPVTDGTVFILSGILDRDDIATGSVLLFCEEKSTQYHATGRNIST